MSHSDSDGVVLPDGKIPVCGLVGDGEAPVPARRVSVDVRAVETVAHVTIKAEFQAAGGIPKATFRCPLDDTRAAVTGLTLISASRGTVHSVVKPKPANARRGGRRRNRYGGGSGNAGADDMADIRDMFQLAVGAIEEGEAVEIILDYVAELPVDNKKVLLTLPTGVTFPECLAAGDAVGLTGGDGGADRDVDVVMVGNNNAEEEAAAAGAAEVAAAATPAPTAQVSVTFQSATVPADVKCPTHNDAVVRPCGVMVADGAPAATVEPAPGGGDEGKAEETGSADVVGYTVTWAGASGLESNLVVEVYMGATWQPAALFQSGVGADASAAAVVPLIPNAPPLAASGKDGKDGKDGKGTMEKARKSSFMGMVSSLFTSSATTTSQHQITTQVIFILDRSGSMGGSKFDAVKECMRELLQVLPASAGFDVLSFGSHFTTMFKACKPATPETVETALGDILGMRPDMGGTNLADPLAFVYSQIGETSMRRQPRNGGAKGEYLRSDIPVQLIVLTDGCVDNRRDTINLVKDNTANSRCFTFGIGRDVDAALVKGMAFAGHGRCSFVGASAALRKQAARRLAKALQRCWYRVSVEWGTRADAGVVHHAPAHVPPMFHGEEELVYALGGAPAFGNAAPASFKVKYLLDGTPHTLRVPVVNANGRLPPDTIAKLAARAYIKDHEMTAGPDAGPAVAAHVTPLCVKYGIASRYAAINLPASAAEAAAEAAREAAAAAAAAAAAQAVAAVPPPAPAAASGGGAVPTPPSASIAQTLRSQLRRRSRSRSRASSRGSSSSDSDSSNSLASLRSMASPVGDGAFYDDDDDDEDAFNAPSAAAAGGYVVSYRCASDSSSGSENEDAAGNIVQRSSAMRTTTWAPRSRARQPKAWNAGGGPVDGWFQRHGWRVVRGQDRVWVQAGGTSGRAALQSRWAW